MDVVFTCIQVSDTTLQLIKVNFNGFKKMAFNKRYCYNTTPGLTILKLENVNVLHEKIILAAGMIY